MTLHIRNPDHIPAALRSMTDTIALYPRMPESIKGWMLAVPCKRILRAAYAPPIGLSGLGWWRRCARMCAWLGWACEVGFI